MVSFAVFTFCSSIQLDFFFNSIIQFLRQNTDSKKFPKRATNIDSFPFFTLFLFREERVDFFHQSVNRLPSLQTKDLGWKLSENLLQQIPGKRNFQTLLWKFLYLDYWTCLSLPTGLSCLKKVPMEKFTLRKKFHWNFLYLVPRIQIRNVPERKADCEKWLLLIFEHIVSHHYKFDLIQHGLNFTVYTFAGVIIRIVLSFQFLR